MIRYRLLQLSLVVLAFSSILPVKMARSQAEGENGSRQLNRPVVQARNDMVVAANPIAAKVGSDILRQGGNAIDAAIATQLMLGLVEPSASGIGGGGFLVYYDAQSKQIRTYDGRETAPSEAKPDRFLDAKGNPLGFYEAVIGGRSVGVPGILRMLEKAHKAHGQLPWRQLLIPAIRKARTGFPISPRLNMLLSREPFLSRQEPAKSYFYQPDGKPKPIGQRLVNLAYADVLAQVANSGADAFYQGRIATDIVATVQQAPTPGDLTATDLASYQAIERSPICGMYRVYKVCGMGPPSSGGLTVLQILGILEPFNLAALQPGSPAAIHLFAEAGRLAYADRGIYMADSDFVTVPTDALLNPNYLQRRAKLINPNQAMREVQPGQLPLTQSKNWGQDHALEFPSTSHLSIMDRNGNAVAMTTSIEDVFGSRLMVHGFLLNNQLTDFSFSPATPDGRPIANRVEAKKRPRSSMSPTLVFDRNGKVILAVGSAGGSRIINYVTKTLVAVLDWRLDIQQAISLPNFGNRNGPTELEIGTTIDALQAKLKALGHSVNSVEQTSGTHGIQRTPQGLMGGTDPRREGVAVGR